MNTVELLLKADAKGFSELPTAEYEIESLSERLGGEFIVKLRAIPSRKYSDIIGQFTNNSGDIVPAKAVDMHAMLVVESMIEPSMKDEKLMEHFGVKTPKDLAIKLFEGGNLVKLSNAITKLSGYSEEELKEIKN